ncbi:MAG: 50S ribosomal protein L25, partial [Thermoleophilaceae bacterium]|nr:50S ribosomal protein L25 [Thermoleophilaceae bacterium]
MAAAQRPSIALDERTAQGSRAARRLRRAGLVPGVLYGGGDGEAVAFQVGSRDLRQALLDGSAVLDAKIGTGKARPVIVKDQQFHPVRGEVVHIDLLQVRLDEKIASTVHVELEGVEDAPGVKEGGVLEHVTRELNIEALPTDIPERVLVDVSAMEIAGTMHLSEVGVPDGVALLDDLEETIIATITPPSEVEEEPGVEEETELVGEEGEEVAEGESPAEREAPAEGAESADEGS